MHSALKIAQYLLTFSLVMNNTVYTSAQRLFILRQVFMQPRLSLNSWVFLLLLSDLEFLMFDMDLSFQFMIAGAHGQSMFSFVLQDFAARCLCHLHFHQD